MLTLTENAATAVKGLTDQTSDARTGGLRIRNAQAEDTSFELTLVPGPNEEDTVVEIDGARVFIDPTVADVLETRILDARVADDGSVRFALGQQD